ncbi:MAG: hypothetical protein AMXMBFR46_25450 [Acidimicrobiia bacterium]
MRHLITAGKPAVVALAVVLLLASSAAAGSAPPARSAVAGAVLGQDTFDACSAVADLYGTTVSGAEARSLARDLAALKDREARKHLAPTLRDASSAKERTRAVNGAYRWCERDAGAYEETDLALTSPTVLELVDTDTVTVTGTASPGATVTVATSASRNAEAIAGPDGVFSAIITGLPFGESTVSVSATAPLRYPSRSLTMRLRRSESEGAYKASAREVPPDELKKDPAGLRGTRAYARGEVFQYDARTGLSAMLVYVNVVNPGRYEFWTDPVLVRLESPTLGSGIDEDDIVELWGEIQGAYSYSTAIGGTNTVPEIRVRYMNLLEKK